jgi:hypothetical protein
MALMTATQQSVLAAIRPSGCLGSERALADNPDRTSEASCRT